MSDLATATVDPSDLATAAPFRELFPAQPAVRGQIERAMRRRGFDPSKPIDVWRQRDVVVDGHTRRDAAIAAGVRAVVFYHDFADEAEALEYAVANQRDRRNLTDADIVRCVEALDRREPKGGDRRSGAFKASPDALKSEPKTAAHTAALIGTTQTKVERARTILDHADDETKKEVLEKGHSINMAYNKTQARRRRNLGNIVPHPAVMAAGAGSAERPAAPEIERESASPRELDERLYRAMTPHLDALRSVLDDEIGPRTLAWAGPLHRLVRHVVSMPPPVAWPPCSACKGKGIARGTCARCRGCGYLLPKLQA